MHKVTVSVPASTANLGAGFDCLGLALQLRNTIELQEITHGLEIQARGEGAEYVPRTERNLIARAAEKVFATVGRRPTGLRIYAVNGIPLSSGMGSSAATVVGGLVAANALVEGGLTEAQLLHLAHEMEGHPDNAAAALYGGLVLISASDDQTLVKSVPMPPLTVVIALPQVRLSTAEARAALPAQVPLKDAVFNIGRALFAVQALTTGDAQLLRWAIADRLHQPYRKRLIPGYEAVETSARAAGALAVALSGAGPSLIAFATERHAEIAQAMQAAFKESGVASRTFVLPVDPQGVQVITDASA